MKYQGTYRHKELCGTVIREEVWGDDSDKAWDEAEKVYVQKMKDHFESCEICQSLCQEAEAE